MQGLPLRRPRGRHAAAERGGSGESGGERLAPVEQCLAGSKIAPSLLKPEYIKYTDVDGTVTTILGIPAERYVGNEDARGGFGALVYPDVLGQILRGLESSGLYDPAHPPFFLLHSDGDNYGGGTDSYYGSNTGAMVEWLKSDPRFELTTVMDYLDRFPADPANAVHVEPGSWSGADNGDPQFMKWFSGYNSPYSPDLNSWAVLTALQNAVHSFLDAGGDSGRAEAAERLMLTAETSCYWYWTGQEIWDTQVTAAANAALGIIENDLNAIVAANRDTTPPTIFPPWITPENPGGKTWGRGISRTPGRSARCIPLSTTCPASNRSGCSSGPTPGPDRSGKSPSSTRARIRAAPGRGRSPPCTRRTCRPE
ncbi:MAG: hypothetical protein LUG50_14475 [Planctomycetaceae bacterium]|nr:hypothetical protein [Planctomycetaceae bacterium]